MRFPKSLAFLAVLSACSTHHYYTPTTDVAATEVAVNESERDIASQGTGIPYQTYTFNMAQLKGQTYITFVKQKVKPALDSYADTKNGGGGGFKNIGSSYYFKNNLHLDPKTASKYRGAKWNRASRRYEGGLSDQQIGSIFDSLKTVKPISDSYSLCYYDRDDKTWSAKNDMALAAKDAKVNTSPFDLCTLYALTGGIGVKVVLDQNNFNYHVLYKTGRLDPHQEVMSGRSFSSSPGRNVADATDPEYLRDLQQYLTQTQDQKPFYRNLILSLADTNTSELRRLSPLGQAVLADFLTVYTAEAVRHLMVNLQDGMHPWEIDLAAVTFVSSLSVKLGKVVTGGRLVDSDIGAWFAPSPNNVAGGPQRSGIGITRRDRKIFQKAIHAYEMSTPDGAEIIKKIQAIIGTRENRDDVIQGVFEFLSNTKTPARMGSKAVELADLMATLIEEAREDADEIARLIK